jgi:hypothetical protein
MVRRPPESHGDWFQHVAAKGTRSSRVLDFPDRGGADLGTPLNFLAGEVKLFDAGGEEPGEYQPVFGGR